MKIVAASAVGDGRGDSAVHLREPERRDCDSVLGGLLSSQTTMVLPLIMLAAVALCLWFCNFLRAPWAY
jgi:hypothetical protein